MLVVVGEPSDGKYNGGEIVAPTFRKIVESMADLEIFNAGRGGTT
jgi:hypothetical protein